MFPSLMREKEKERKVRQMMRGKKEDNIIQKLSTQLWNSSLLSPLANV